MVVKLIQGRLTNITRRDVESALKELKFICTKTRLTDGPTLYASPEYGKKIQYAIQDLSPDLDPEVINYIKQVT